MRYSRALTVLALVGAVGLAVTLLTGRAPRARPTVKAAATTPKPPGALQQAFQQFFAPKARLVPAPQRLVPPSEGQTCFVDQCSLKPCVEFTQGGSQPSTTISTGEVVQVVSAPAIRSIPLGQAHCTRRAGPQTLRVSAPTLSVSKP